MFYRVTFRAAGDRTNRVVRRKASSEAEAIERATWGMSDPWVIRVERVQSSEGKRPGSARRPSTACVERAMRSAEAAANW